MLDREQLHRCCLRPYFTSLGRAVLCTPNTILSTSRFVRGAKLCGGFFKSWCFGLSTTAIGHERPEREVTESGRSIASSNQAEIAARTSVGQVRRTTVDALYNREFLVVRHNT